AETRDRSSRPSGQGLLDFASGAVRQVERLDQQRASKGPDEAKQHSDAQNQRRLRAVGLRLERRRLNDADAGNPAVFERLVDAGLLQMLGISLVMVLVLLHVA